MRKRDRRFIYLIAACGLLLTACQSRQSAISNMALPECQCIRETATNKMLFPDQLISRLANAPLVIIGEEHTRPEHHQVETWLLQHLNRSRPQGSVLMEMIDSSQQAAVNRVKAESLSGTVVSASRAAEALRWNSGWPWPLYRDVVMTALQARYPLLAANISRQQTAALYQHPVFPQGEHSSSPQVHKALSAIIYLMHGGQIEGEQMTSMLAIQQQRDRFMATQLIGAPRPALLIAGGYHAAKDIGVPLHVADLGASAPVVVILTGEGTTLTPLQADYQWAMPQ